MPTVAPNMIRAALTSESAKAAFDKLNAFKPRWIVETAEKGIVMVPTIEIKDLDTCGLRSPFSATLVKSFDEAIQKDLAELVEAAKKPNIIIVVNSTSRDSSRNEYNYDNRADDFMPQPPRK